MKTGAITTIAGTGKPGYSGDGGPAIGAQFDGVFGIDISKATPTLLVDDMVREADVVITMGCGDACPLYPGKRYLDWELDDPAGRSLEEVRVIRDAIDVRIRQLATELTAEVGVVR